MSDPQDGYFRVGNNVYPVPTTGNNFLLKHDPAIYWLMDYFTQMLRTYAGADWAHAAAYTNLTMTDIVGYSVPYNPLPYFQAVNFNFPLLALYRVTGKTKAIALTRDSTKTILELQYWLPPISPEQLEVFNPFLNSVFKIIQNRSQQHYDPNYLNGFKVNDAAGYQEMTAHVDYEMKFMEKAGNLFFPGIIITLEMKEMNDSVAGQFAPIQEIDAQIDLLTNTTPIEHFVDLTIPVPNPAQG